MFEECQPQSPCLPDKARFRTISSNSCIDSRPSRFESMARNSSAHLKSGDRALELKAEKVPFDERLSMNRHLYWWFWDSSFSNAPFFVHLSKLVRTDLLLHLFQTTFFQMFPLTFSSFRTFYGTFRAIVWLSISFIYMSVHQDQSVSRQEAVELPVQGYLEVSSKSGGKSPTKNHLFRWAWCPFHVTNDTYKVDIDNIKYMWPV